MSNELINHSPDLQRLVAEGYEIFIRADHLLVGTVPYINAQGAIAFGVLVSELSLAGTKATKPATHVVHFQGDHPCNKDGTEIASIKHQSQPQTLADDVSVDHSFSNKPAGGYADYFEKVERYVEVISAPARSLDPHITAKTFGTASVDETINVFQYPDTNSTRAEIVTITEKLRGQCIRIIGAGGTASYVLDFVAKCPVAEIHLYDADQYFNHNAYRSPGAASLDALQQAPKKVDYLACIYGNMHKKVIPHPYHVTNENVAELAGADFIFICIDDSPSKADIVEFLERENIAYADCGMGVDASNGQLAGIIRTTLGTPENKGQARSKGRINFAAVNEDEDYETNVQIAELNAMNAVLAVVQWKKRFGVYRDSVKEDHITYTIDVGMLANDKSDS